MSAAPAVRFTELKQATRGEWHFLRDHENHYLRRLPDRLMAELRRLDADDSVQGYQVSRLGHSLQTATRAEADGADIEMIVAALIHDIGDGLATVNHSQMAASVIEPYVRAEVTWVVKMHGLFQMQYYAHHFDLDNQAHMAYRDHPWFGSCQRFCERWDQAAFDPAYDTQTLEHFEPMLREVFSRTPFDPAIVNPHVAMHSASSTQSNEASAP
jgi:predicted HD phosphohydrolase